MKYQTRFYIIRIPRRAHSLFLQNILRQVKNENMKKNNWINAEKKEKKCVAICWNTFVMLSLVYKEHCMRVNMNQVMYYTSHNSPVTTLSAPQYKPSSKIAPQQASTQWALQTWRASHQRNPGKSETPPQQTQQTVNIPILPCNCSATCSR